MIGYCRRQRFWPLRTASLLVVGATLVSAQTPAPGSKPEARGKTDRRPALTLRANPAVSFSPARVFFVAELRGGADDYEEFYCAAVEWDWGDGTKSQASYDCEPYQPGKSEIRRRFLVEHIFNQAGTFRVQFRLKRGDKVVATASTTVQIRPGVRDIGG